MDLSFGGPLLALDLREEAFSLAPAFADAKTTIVLSLTERGRLVDEVRLRLNRLGATVQAFRRNIRYRQAVEQQPREVLLLYGLGSQGRLPAVSRNRDWLVEARRLQQGEEEALARGYPGAVSPSLEELNSRLQDAEVMVGRLDEVNLRYQDQLESLRALRAQADGFVLRLGAFLNYALKLQPPSLRRQVMRGYGFSFLGGTRHEAEGDPEPVEGEEEEPWPQEIPEKLMEGGNDPEIAA